MTAPLKVVAAMSGGVDSAVAAARAVDAGHEVVGVHLALSKNPETGRDSGRGCCTLSDARDARRSADILGIPFYVWDMAEEFSDGVLDDFVAEYLAGRTPNPCMRCNEKLKFSAVLERSMARGRRQSHRIRLESLLLLAAHPRRAHPCDHHKGKPQVVATTLLRLSSLGAPNLRPRVRLAARRRR